MTELGNRLKEAREEKGMSLDDLQAATKIQKRYLTALEEGNYDVIPGKFYVRAFIKQYAEAVGLNSEQLFEEFKKDIPDSYNDEVSDKLSSIKPQRELPGPASKALELLPTLLVSAGVIVVIAIIYVIVQAVMGGGNENSAEQTKTVETESKYDVSKDSPLKNENQKNADNEKSGAEDKKDDAAQKAADKKELTIKAADSQGSSTTYEVSGADKLELEVTTTADSWVRVRDAKGTSLKEGMMKKGDSFQKNITDQDQIELRVGYAPGVEIKINGKVLSYELDPKNVMTQNITIENKKEKKSS
ncbi:MULTISPECIES: helix-turn-helix domain-containing protein [Bacillus]|uniref:helix-turn-helix domain-containing protein n=1 Tax=Bacillus TaxID=1386 RepID=UPI001582DFE3|nr:RodZ family helix-turn-helix domain-containing protein [Bacillus glycinifermentans]MBU8786488.1 helix-turn-helix domain-containing protein [Bacillus glycinifermentans]